MRPEIAKTLELEGGYVNDPNDAGGETNFGISKRTYPDLDIAGLTKDSATVIYERDFFTKYALDTIQDIRVRWKVFDMAVNLGPKVAFVLAQIATASPPDGVLGARSFININVMNPDVMLGSLCDLQNIWYLGIVSRNPTQHKFLQGWLKRATDKGLGLV
jgi:lysozyme family protein